MADSSNLHDEKSPKRRPMLSSIRSTSFGTLLSRLTGYVRELAWSAYIGPTRFSDIFLLAYTVPNLLRRLLGEGSFASAFLPVLSKVERESGLDEARRFTSKVMAVQSIISIAYTLLIMVCCLFFFYFGNEEQAIYAEYIGIMAPYSIFICACAILSAVLNIRGVYFIPAIVQVIMNISWIVFVLIAAFVLDTRFGLNVLGLSVVLSCAFAAWLLLRKAKKTGFEVDIHLFGHRHVPALKGFLSKYFLTIFGVAAFQINVLIDRLMAQFIVADEGSMTVLYQGERLMQYPLGLLAVAIGTVALSELSRVADNKRRFFFYFHKAMKLSFFLSIMMTVLFCLLSVQVVDLALNWGEFARNQNINALGRTSLVLLCYSAGFPAYFLLTVLTRTFYSMQDMASPVRIGGWMVLLNFLLNLLFLWVTPLDEAGLALSSAFCAYLNVFALLFMLNRKNSWLRIRAMLKGVPLLVLASLPAVGVLFVVIWLIGGGSGASLLFRAVRFFVPATAFLITYIGVVRLFGIREATDIFRRGR